MATESLILMATRSATMVTQRIATAAARVQSTLAMHVRNLANAALPKPVVTGYSPTARNAMTEIWPTATVAQSGVNWNPAICAKSRECPVSRGGAVTALFSMAKNAIAPMIPDALKNVR